MIPRNSQNNQFPRQHFLELIARAQRTGLSRDPRFGQLMTWLQVDPEDSEIRDIATEAIERAELEALISPDPFRATNPTSVNELPGTVGLGVIPPNCIPWLITPEMLTNHVLIAGRSGGGKTNLILLILAQLLENRRNA